MHSHIVVGLAFGDEGKGSWVDHVCRREGIKTVVRFNGGAQALHHVTTEDGRVHGFRQFGSHSFIPGAKTMLSRYMLIEPVQMLFEVDDLSKLGVFKPLRNLYVSADAPIIPFTNVYLNQVIETARGQGRHGSCGLGIGLTQRDIDEGTKPVIRAGDLGNRALVAEKLHAHFALTLKELQSWEMVADSVPYKYLQSFAHDTSKFDWYLDRLVEFASLANVIPEAAFLSILRRTPVVFEGAQGALLDQHNGFFPYCTRSTTTARNAKQLLADAGFVGESTTHGLLRAYGTRHGVGPFVTEAVVPVAACDNTTGQWQGDFRIGWFDAVAARYALSFSPVDEVVLTNLDRLDGCPQLRVAAAYSGMTDEFYDAARHCLLQTDTYPLNESRTAQLLLASPGYQDFSGWENERHTSQETYIEGVEDLIGEKIVALSRRKDHHKHRRK